MSQVRKRRLNANCLALAWTRGLSTGHSKHICCTYLPFLRRTGAIAVVGTQDGSWHTLLVAYECFGDLPLPQTVPKGG